MVRKIYMVFCGDLSCGGNGEGDSGGGPTFDVQENIQKIRESRIKLRIKRIKKIKKKKKRNKQDSSKQALR